MACFLGREKETKGLFYLLERMVFTHNRAVVCIKHFRMYKIELHDQYIHYFQCICFYDSDNRTDITFGLDICLANWPELETRGLSSVSLSFARYKRNILLTISLCYIFVCYYYVEIFSRKTAA